MTKSIVWKLTLFVGVLVAINTALLIGVAYITTSAILQDEVKDRLNTVAGDRQEILLHELNQQVERAVGFANRSRMGSLLIDRAHGTLPAQRFREEAEAFLSSVRANITSLLAIWVEDDAGRIIASSGLSGKLADSPRRNGSAWIRGPRADWPSRCNGSIRPMGRHSPESCGMARITSPEP